MKITDHLGNEFESIKDMCEFHHIPSKIYDNRVNRHHWSMEKALTTPLKVNKNEDIKKTQEESKEPITAKTEKTVSIEETVQTKLPKLNHKSFNLFGNNVFDGVLVLQALGFADDFIASIIGDLDDASLAHIVRYELKDKACNNSEALRNLEKLINAFKELTFVKSLKLDEDFEEREQFRQKLLEFAA